MKRKKGVKIFFAAVAGLLLLALLLVAVMFLRQWFISRKINDDYTAVLQNPAYQTPVSVSGIPTLAQEISCGYAILEMLADWQGKGITEQTLFADNKGAVTTAMGTGFLDEISKQFPEWEIARHINLTNSELLQTVYETLAAGMPVPIEFAALRDTGSGKVWTLHFAVVVGMDLQKDVVFVQNPYGYEETYSVNEFLRATRYDSYEDMELFFRFGFAFGLFHKNTVYTIQNKASGS